MKPTPEERRKVRAKRKTAERKAAKREKAAAAKARDKRIKDHNGQTALFRFEANNAEREGRSVRFPPPPPLRKEDSARWLWDNRIKPPSDAEGLAPQA